MIPLLLPAPLTETLRILALAVDEPCNPLDVLGAAVRDPATRLQRQTASVLRAAWLAEPGLMAAAHEHALTALTRLALHEQTTGHDVCCEPDRCACTCCSARCEACDEAPAVEVRIALRDLLIVAEHAGVPCGHLIHPSMQGAA